MNDLISRRDAIDTIGNVPDCNDGMVFEALSHAQRDVALLPSADVEPVVRCKDCIDWNSETLGCKRNPSVSPWWENDFCSYGERMDGEQTVQAR